MKPFLLVIAVTGSIAASDGLWAQPSFSATNTSFGRFGPPPIISPEVHADRTVTFRVRAPKAGEVRVSGEFGDKVMTNDGTGLWSVTVGPLEPDLYGYGFSVDGFRTLDPANTSVKPMRSPTTSMLDVPDDQPLMHDFRADVAHGTVRLHTYPSRALGKLRRLQVYTPPDYDRKSRTRYPVLYLLHGSGDNEATWTALGRAHWIADNLIARHLAKPLIIVMTDGHAAFANPPPGSGDERTRNRQAFQRDLIEDVMPFVEASYRTRTDRESRAIIGLSMGGGQSLSVGLKHLDRFAWVGGMSSGVRDPEQMFAGVLGDAQATNQKLKLLWIACGQDDFLLKPNRQFDELLTARGIRHEFRLSEGGHSWPVWRRYLAEFLPRLFTK